MGNAQRWNSARKPLRKTNTILCFSEVVKGFKTLGKGHNFLGYSWLIWLARLKNQRGKNEIVIYFYLSLQLGELSEKAEGAENLLTQREPRDSGKGPSDLCPAFFALNEYFRVLLRSVKQCFYSFSKTSKLFTCIPMGICAYVCMFHFHHKADWDDEVEQNRTESQNHLGWKRPWRSLSPIINLTYQVPSLKPWPLGLHLHKHNRRVSGGRDLQRPSSPTVRLLYGWS